MSFGATTRQPAPKKKLGGLDADRINTHQQAIPVPYIAGRRRVALIWFTPPYNQREEKVKQKVGKSGNETVGHILHVDQAGMICLGGRKPVDRIYKHIFDEEVVWEHPAGLSRDTDPYEPITIVGVGATRIYWGTPDQPIDTLILTPKSSTPPADPGFNPRVVTTWPDSDQTLHHPD